MCVYSKCVCVGERDVILKVNISKLFKSKNVVSLLSLAHLSSLQFPVVCFHKLNLGLQGICNEWMNE